MEKCYCCGKELEGLVDLGFHKACEKCLSLNGNTWENIDINMEDDAALKLYELAHKENVPFNMFVSRCLRDFVEGCGDMTPEEIKEKFHTEGVKIDGENKA
jgi:hypothetical protein